MKKIRLTAVIWVFTCACMFADELPSNWERIPVTPEMNDNDIGIYYLAKSIDAIGKVDGLVFMPGWENSRGCKIEYQVAKEYGKFIREVK